MFNSKKLSKVLIIVLSLSILFLGIYAFASEGQEAAKEIVPGSTTPWWVWPLVLFVVTFILGILAVLGGVGGGVLFVPIVGGFFPFNIDFVRGAGLLVALAGALAAGPGLLKRNLASLRLAIPVALIASAAAIVGAMIGLALKPNVVNILLGATILFIVLIMAIAKKSDFPKGSSSRQTFTGTGNNWNIP